MKASIYKSNIGYELQLENCCTKQFDTREYLDQYLVKLNALKYKTSSYLMIPTNVESKEYDFFFHKNGQYYKLQGHPKITDYEAAKRFVDSHPRVFVL